MGRLKWGATRVAEPGTLLEGECGQRYADGQRPGKRPTTLRSATHETGHGSDQALQTRRSARGTDEPRGRGPHRYRSEGFWPSEGPYRNLSRRRIRRQLPAEGKDRGDRKSVG